jgi:predicted DCC family thiol-disulfide oxidoreductase YuxK
MPSLSGEHPDSLADRFGCGVNRSTQQIGQKQTSTLAPAPLLKPGETVLLFDGVCKLCNGWARFLMRHDRHRRVRLAAVQSPEGLALLAWAGLPLHQFDTMAVIRDRHYWVRSDAFFEVITLLPAPWRPVNLLRSFPRKFRDWAYDRIALNRYWLFGKYDTCLLPDPDHEQRFLKAPL